MERGLVVDVLRRGLDLRPALRAVAGDGAAFVASALNEAFRRQLVSEAQLAPFQRMPEYEGRARQDGDVCVIRAGLGRYPLVVQLRDELARLVRAAGRDIAGYADWRPNEVSIQRYQPRGLGITPHLDLKRYRYLVAVVTATGSAPFTLCRDRAGTPLVTWDAGPGSLTLLRGPGLVGHDDGRPLHAVAGPDQGERLSIGFRMATVPGRHG